MFCVIEDWFQIVWFPAETIPSMIIIRNTMKTPGSTKMSVIKFFRNDHDICNNILRYDNN